MGNSYWCYYSNTNCTCCAGGVFKQILIDTEAGKVVAELMSNLGLPVIIFIFCCCNC